MQPRRWAWKNGPGASAHGSQTLANGHWPSRKTDARQGKPTPVNENRRLSTNQSVSIILDHDLENTSLENLDIPNVDAPHEVLGDFLTSHVRVVNHRKDINNGNRSGICRG